MTVTGGDPGEAAAAIVAAINDREHEQLGSLLGADAEIVTGRSVHSGPEAILAWASKEYDHLRRIYAIDEYRSVGSQVLRWAPSSTWSEGGEVADSTPIALEIEPDGGRMARLTVHDDVRAALIEFRSKRP